jgi:hypothetical protein
MLPQAKTGWARAAGARDTAACTEMKRALPLQLLVCASDIRKAIPLFYRML